MNLKKQSLSALICRNIELAIELAMTSHREIVDKILPRMAERLKREGLISAFDKKQFKIRLFKESEPIRVNPDLVLHSPDGDKFLIEVANPEKPKRFIGEIIYPQILGNFKEIKAFFMFVLEPQKRRSLTQITLFHQIFRKQTRSRFVSWPDDREVAYRWLREFIKGLRSRK